MNDDLTQKVMELDGLFRRHKHLGIDMTQLLPAQTSTKNTYGGAITSTAGGVFPTGWTVAVNGSTKIFTVTHNLNTTSYSVVSIPASFALQANLLTHGINTFTIEFDNSSGTAFVTDWDFVLTLI